jgi:hypothetical protein
VFHQACHVIVPRYYIYNASLYSSEEEYYKVMGYKQVEGDGDAPLENTDVFVGRMNGTPRSFKHSGNI